MCEKWNANGKIVEVLLVSGDRDESGFRKTVTGFPWLAVPFGELRERRRSIEKFIPCTGYPTPAIVNAKTGEILSADAFDESWDISLIDKYLANC